jgi:hypothetical protein
MYFLDNITLLLATGISLTGALYDVPGNGACFFHCIVGFFINYYESSKIPDDFFPLDSTELREYVCKKLLERKDGQITGFLETPASYFVTEYGPSARNRKFLHSGTWNNQMSQNGHDPQEHPLKVDNFNDYVAWMSNPDTQVDEMIVAFTADLLQINLKVFTRSVSEVSEVSEDVKVSRLISMGFSKNQAEQALAKANRNLERAIETILFSPQSQHSEHSHEEQQQIWREQPYSNMSGGTTVYLINDGAHFQLLYPEDEFENESGGAAAQAQSETLDLLSFQFESSITTKAFNAKNENIEQELSNFLNGSDASKSLHHVFALENCVLLDFLEDQPQMSSGAGVFEHQPQMSSEATVFEQKPQMSSEAGFFDPQPQMITGDQFINLCSAQLTSLRKLPPHSDIQVRLSKDNLVFLMKFLSKRFTIPALGLKYRVVAFCLDDGSRVSYTGSSHCDVSRRAQKIAFFDELFSKISDKMVTSVRLEKL